MNRDDFNEGLLGFLDASPTPFHAALNMSMMFLNAGFIELDEKQSWSLEAGKRYFVKRNDSSIIAFTYPDERKGYVMLGAHTDSPNLKLKPKPLLREFGVVKFGVEPYGGLLLNPWFDRDLSIAGRVSYERRDGALKSALIDAKKALAIIPSLAIHLDDKANSDRSINKQTDITPILTTNEDFDFEEFLLWQLHRAGTQDAAKVFAHELSLYDTQKAAFVGVRDDFIASARLDNLLSCYVGMLTLCSVDASKPMLFIASDHEEVGSESSSGAAGSFLENTLRRITPEYEAYVQMLQESLLISTDNAHAIHPNFPSKHDSSHAPKINAGVVVKVNANQRYASNATTISRFLQVAQNIGEPTQHFVTRSDMGCGSTIGPITATRLGINTIDVGLPTFAMHSIRELCGSEDAYSLYKILLAFES